MRSVLTAAAVVLACAALPALGQVASPGEERPATGLPSSAVSYSPRVSDRPPEAASLARTARTGEEAEAAASGVPEALSERAATSPGPGLSLTTIPLGEPADIAVMSPDERWAYAFAQGESTIFVIDLRKLKVVKRFNLAYALWSLAISEDGNRLFLAATQPRGKPHGPCMFIIVGSSSKPSLLAVDAHIGAVIGVAPLSGISLHAVLSPDGTQVVAVNYTALDVIDSASHTASKRLAVPQGFHPYSAVFADGGRKLFASAPGEGLAVFDLATGRSHLLTPPSGYTFFGIHTSVVEAADRVFTTLVDAAGQAALAVIEGQTEEVTVVPEAKAGGFGGALFSPRLSRLFLPGSALVLDAVSLQPIGQLPDEQPNQLTGVAGQLSPDESTLYYRPFGAPEDSLTLWGDPARYDLSIVDTRTLQSRFHFDLQGNNISCSDASPLLIGRSGRTLVALNPSLETLSILKISP